MLLGERACKCLRGKGWYESGLMSCQVLGAGLCLGWSGLNGFLSETETYQGSETDGGSGSGDRMVDELRVACPACSGCTLF